MTLVSGGGIHKLRAIERFSKTTIRRERLPSVETVAARRGDALVARLRETLAAGPYPAEARLVERVLAEGRTPADVAAAILHHFAPSPPVGGSGDQVAGPRQADGPSRDREPRRPPRRPERGRAASGKTGSRKTGRPKRPKSCRARGC